MIDRVVAEFVDGFADEKSVYMPFRALLHAEGYHQVHFMHGHTEWGRDFVGQKRKGRRLTQFGFQLKNGDIQQSSWLDIKAQCEIIYDTDMVHPGIDDTLPREAVLVLTGRLKGNAAQLAKQWEAKVASRQLGRFSVWDRDTLFTKFRAHLAASTGAEWAILGHLVEQCREGTAGLEQLEVFSQRWLGITGWQAMLEYCLVREFLVRNGLTLHAFHLFLGLARRFAWKSDFESSDWLEFEQVLRDELRWYSEPILTWFAGVSPEMRKHAVVDVSPMEIASCGARLFLMLEIVALDLLVNGVRQREVTADLLGYALELGTIQRPLSDQYAVSLILITLACRKLELDCQKWLHQVVVWVGDAYEKREHFGLAGIHGSPLDELRRVLSPPGLGGLKPNSQSLVATATLQALQLLDARDLLSDAAKDFELLRISAGRLQPVSWPEEILVDGRGCHFRLEILDAIAEGATVRSSDDFARPFDKAGKSWLALMFMALLRDRWWSYSLKQLSKPFAADSNAVP